jgi:hypothetical protein
LSAKAGDSIILKEAPSPAGKYTVINVNNPMLPKFDGYIDSAVLLSYPQQTLIPAFLRFGVYNGLSLAHVIHYKNRMLILQGNGVDMYQIQNNNLVFVDTFMLPSTMPISQMLLLNDSLLAVVADSSFSSNSIFGYGSSISGRHSYMYSFQLANSGFSSFPAYTVPENNYHSFGQGPTSSYWNSDSSGYSYIRGFYNDGILISIKQFNSSASRNGGGTSTSSRDSSASVAVVNGNLGMVYSRSNPNAGWFDSSTSNTGHYLSPTENLCSAGPALFVSDIRDLSDGYHTALANNAVYQDSAAGAPRNILLDTLHKMAYLFYDSKLSILTYQRQIVGVANQSNKPSGLKNISIVPNASRSGVTIVLPAASYNADLFIYDLSGRVVDKIGRITSNAVFWRPKSKSMNFYIVVVKSGKEQYLSKFIVR